MKKEELLRKFKEKIEETPRDIIENTFWLRLSFHDGAGVPILGSTIMGEPERIPYTDKDDLSKLVFTIRGLPDDKLIVTGWNKQYLTYVNTENLKVEKIGYGYLLEFGKHLDGTPAGKKPEK